jgi:hypothetical protein
LKRNRIACGGVFDCIAKRTRAATAGIRNHNGGAIRDRREAKSGEKKKTLSPHHGCLRFCLALSLDFGILAWVAEILRLAGPSSAKQL